MLGSNISCACTNSISESFFCKAMIGFLMLHVLIESRVKGSPPKSPHRECLIATTTRKSWGNYLSKYHCFLDAYPCCPSDLLRVGNLVSRGRCGCETARLRRLAAVVGCELPAILWGTPRIAGDCDVLRPAKQKHWDFCSGK